jgi:hypothetical protein
MTLRAKQRIVNLTASFPLLWLVLVYVFILRARIHFGHWPSATDGMAKYQHFASIHHTVACWLLILSPIILLTVIVSAFVCRKLDTGFRAWIPITIMLGSILLWVAITVGDPGGFILWFID